MKRVTFSEPFAGSATAFVTCELCAAVIGVISTAVNIREFDMLPEHDPRVLHADWHREMSR